MADYHPRRAKPQGRSDRTDRKRKMTSAESPANPATAAANRDGPHRYRPFSLTFGRVRRNLAGYALAWPWFDGLSAWILRRLYFPASRLWASAQIADGSAERFWHAVPIQRRLEHGEPLEAA